MTHVQEILDPLTVTKTSVTLAIYSADVDVRLDKKIAVELHRSTKKNPPSRLKYELIYVSLRHPCQYWVSKVPAPDCER